MWIRFLKDWNPRHGYIKHPKGSVYEAKDRNGVYCINEGIAEAAEDPAAVKEPEKVPETATAEPDVERAVIPQPVRRKRGSRKAPTRSYGPDGE